MAKIISSSDFKNEVLDQQVPVLVDFFAEWCAPCKMLAPILEQLSKDVEGNAKVVKIDIDVDTDLAQKYEVMAVPTLIVFKNGEVDNKTTGVQTLDKLKSMVL